MFEQVSVILFRVGGAGIPSPVSFLAGGRTWVSLVPSPFQGLGIPGPRCLLQGYVQMECMSLGGYVQSGGCGHGVGITEGVPTTTTHKY